MGGLTSDITRGLPQRAIERHRERAREAGAHIAAARRAIAQRRGADLTARTLARELGLDHDTCHELLFEVEYACSFDVVAPIRSDPRVEDLARAIDALPWRMRAALHLRLGEGAALDVMARDLGVTEDRAAWLFLVAFAWIRRESPPPRLPSHRAVPAPSAR